MAASEQITGLGPVGCETCREQHLKCDRIFPVCGRCHDSGRKCRRGYKFRRDKRPFEDSQPWIKTPKQLQYIEESPISPFADERSSTRGHDADDRSSSRGTDELYVPSTGGSPVQSQVATRRRASEDAPASPSDRFLMREDITADAVPIESQISLGQSPQQNNGDSSQGGAYDIELLRRRIYLDSPVWPLRDPLEATLFRHFVMRLSVWLDLCDPRQSFETIVPQRAGVCPILLNAVFALAARHLSHTSDFDPLASNRYHDHCLKELISIVNHAVTVADENLFAASIILRVLEEMEVLKMGMDTDGYLLSIHAFVHGGARSLVPNSLSAACFWVGLRQEIYSAVMNHKPVRISLNNAVVDRSLSAADDSTWANRAVVHCADVLNFCFGDGGPSSEARWRELDEWGRAWLAQLPSSFTPIFTTGVSEPGQMPEIWYHTGCYGVQHHILAQLFLVCFDPKLPRVGLHRKEADRRVNQRVHTLVRTICGIGLSNKVAPPTMFTACMAIAAFGDRFHERADQRALLRILKQTEEDHARPTEAVQRQMMKSWDWSPDEANDG